MDLISESSKNEDSNGINKDETRVRRPPNAFMIFGQKFRKELAKKFRNLSNKEISKVLGDEWRKMDRQTKNEYHCLADEAHRKHLEKHPGYYYSPLEARQRKAERKSKLKMSKNSHNIDNHKIINRSIVGPFPGNRPILFRNPPMYPMARPMFGPPLHPRMGFRQQFCCFRPNYPFGRLAPLRPFAFPHPFSQVMKSESIDGIHSSFPEKIESEVEVETYIIDTQTTYSDRGTDIGLLSSFLPPMHNPNIEVTPVLANHECVSDSTNDNEITKMTNAIVEQEFVVKEESEKNVGSHSPKSH